MDHVNKRGESEQSEDGVRHKTDSQWSQKAMQTRPTILNIDVTNDSSSTGADHSLSSGCKSVWGGWKPTEGKGLDRQLSAYLSIAIPITRDIPFSPNYQPTIFLSPSMRNESLCASLGWWL